MLTLPPILITASQWLAGYLVPLPSDPRHASLWQAPWWAWVLSVLACFAVAQALAWNEQVKKTKILEAQIREKDGFISHLHSEISNLAVQNTSLDRQLSSLSEPLFSAEITYAILGDDIPGSSHAALRIRAENRGASAAIIASEWELSITLENGTVFLGSPVTIGNNIQEFCFGPGKAFKFVKEDGIDYKGYQGIGNLRYKEGILCFLITGMHYVDLQKDATTIVISGRAVNGERFFTSPTTVERLRHISKGVFLPGFKYPNLEPSTKCNQAKPPRP